VGERPHQQRQLTRSPPCRRQRQRQGAASCRRAGPCPACAARPQTAGSSPHPRRRSWHRPPRPPQQRRQSRRPRLRWCGGGRLGSLQRLHRRLNPPRQLVLCRGVCRGAAAQLAAPVGQRCRLSSRALTRAQVQAPRHARCAQWLRQQPSLQSAQRGRRRPHPRPHPNLPHRPQNRSIRGTGRWQPKKWGAACRCLHQPLVHRRRHRLRGRRRALRCGQRREPALRGG